MVIQRRIQGEDSTFEPTDIFPVAPSETLCVRCRLRVLTPSSAGLAAAAGGIGYSGFVIGI